MRLFLKNAALRSGALFCPAAERIVRALFRNALKCVTERVFFYTNMKLSSKFSMILYLCLACFLINMIPPYVVYVLMVLYSCVYPDKPTNAITHVLSASIFFKKINPVLISYPQIY